MFSLHAEFERMILITKTKNKPLIRAGRSDWLSMLVVNMQEIMSVNTLNSSGWKQSIKWGVEVLSIYCRLGYGLQLVLILDIFAWNAAS